MFCRVTTGAGWRSFVTNNMDSPRMERMATSLTLLVRCARSIKGGFIRWFLDNLGYRPPEVDAKTKTKGGALWR